MIHLEKKLLENDLNFIPIEILFLSNFISFRKFISIEILDVDKAY